MFTSVQKRAKPGETIGKTVPFDPSKITSAIYKAAMSQGGRDYNMAVYLTNAVLDRLKELYPDRDIVAIEEIQDAVEYTLVHKGHYRVAKAYILYREQHAKMRNADVILNNDNVSTYLGRNDLAVKENANMAYSLQGLNTHIVESVISKFWLEQIYPEQVKNTFESGDFHIHDLGSLAAYCVGWDLKTLLAEGFTGVAGKISSGPAKHFKSALGQIVNFLFTLQGEAAGAQAFSNVDTLLAPFIAYDNLTYKQVKQCLQEFAFNMNVPTRVGFQTPFTNITLDLKVPEFMKNEPVIIGGKYMDSVYGDFQAEMDMFNQAFAEIMCEGDVKKRVFTFPIPTYNITEDFDWDNPVYEKIWEMTARYGIPYFSNFIGSDMNPEDARSMCCRLRLDNRQLHKRIGGLFASSPLTGSIGVVTINMGRLGFVSKDKDDFYSRLGMLMDMARDSLEIKRKVLENWTNEGLYPYIRFYLKEVKMATGNYWTNHFSTIGLVGMNECCLNFLGENIIQPEGRQFAEEVMDYMLKRVLCYQEKTGNLYNLEATPAEGASYKLALKDKAKFPTIITAGTEEAPYYTNSTQLPVNLTDDLFEALKYQEPFQVKYTGGTVFHIYLGEKAPSTKSVKTLVRKICTEFHLPYYTITPTFSICQEHGYISGEQFTCPICAQECEVYSRVVGYIRPVQQYSRGAFLNYSQRSLFDGAVGRERILQLK